MKAKRFEVGKTYYNDGFTIEVIKRTEKTITVTDGINGNHTWRMLIRLDADGEYVIDSTAPKKWRNAYTFRATAEIK